MDASKKTPGLSPEAQLMLCSMQDDCRPEVVARISELLSQCLQWDHIEELVRRHHFGPLLFRALQTRPNANFPSIFLEKLRQHCYASVTYNLRLQRELIDLLCLFEKYHIPVMPFKGPVLASLLYSDVGSRFFKDLDILARQQDILQIRDLLINRGYCLDENLSETDYEYTFVKNQEDFCIELHWDVRSRYTNSRLDAAYVWERAIPQNIFGVSSWGLPPEELFLMLCQHGGKHQWHRLKWLGDLAILINRMSIDWERLLCEAAALRLEESVRQALYTLQSFCDVSLPASLSQELRSDPTLLAYAALLRAHAFRYIRGMPSFSEWRYYIQADVTKHPQSVFPKFILSQFFLYVTSIDKFDVMNQVSSEEQLGIVATYLYSTMHLIGLPVRLLRSHGMGLVRRLI